MQATRECKAYLRLWSLWQRSQEQLDAAITHIASCKVCRVQLPRLMTELVLESSPDELAQALDNFEQIARASGDDAFTHSGQFQRREPRRRPAAPWYFLQHAWLRGGGAIVAVLVLLFIFGRIGWHAPVAQPHCDSVGCISTVGPRSLQLTLSVPEDSISAVYVDWGDLSDPLGGTRIYPAAGIKAVRGSLSIPHEYRPGPPEGISTTMRLRMVPAVFKGFAPVGFPSEANLSPSRRLRILPEKIILDPPDDPSEGQLMSSYQSQHDGVTLGELVESGLRQKLNDARGYLEGGSPNGSEEAVRLYREVLRQLSSRVLQQLNQELLDSANKDAQTGYMDQAARKYRAVFGDY